LHRAGRHAEAVRALQQAAVLLPLNLDVYRALAEAMEADGQAADAASARIGIDAIGRRNALDLYQIGWIYCRHRQWAAACHWFERALMIDPRLLAAHIGTAWALRQLDRNRGAGVDAGPKRAEPRRYPHRAYRRQSIFIDAKAATRRRTVLVLCSSAHANVPFRHLLPAASNRLVRWVADLGTLGIQRARSRQLPPYDVVFNAVGDADMGASCQDELTRFMAAAKRPVLNPPGRVDRTGRERIGRLLQGVRDIVVPPTLRWDRCGGAADSVHAAIAAAKLSYPVIVRPAGEHGGNGVVLLQSPHDAPQLAAMGEMYLTAYHEYRSGDGYYRKYRVIFIDREPFPYHLAIGSQWMLHYFSADMLTQTWKTEEERAFLEDPRGVLGAPAWEALRAIGRRMDLDYCGIDFSLLPDGRVLVFEVNATMLVHPEVEEDKLRFKNVHVQAITGAFDQLLQRHVTSPR
jgi:glutathione synthase/RimK-type ligase-like ATP-grasp enzyme